MPISRPTPVPAPVNVVVLAGRLSRPPELRALPSGDALAAYEVTVARLEGPAESVPVVWYTPPARADRFSAGDDVVVVGRVRRRFFRAGGATASRTEVVAATVVPLRSAATVRRSVGRAVEEVASLGG